MAWVACYPDAQYGTGLHEGRCTTSEWQLHQFIPSFSEQKRGRNLPL